MKRGVKMNEQSGKEVFRGRRGEELPKPKKQNVGTKPILLASYKEPEAVGFQDCDPVYSPMSISHGDTGRGPLETQRR